MRRKHPFVGVRRADKVLFSEILSYLLSSCFVKPIAASFAIASNNLLSYYFYPLTYRSCIYSEVKSLRLSGVLYFNTL